VTETPFQSAEVAQAPTAFFGGPQASETAIQATKYALATQILVDVTQTAAVEQTALATALGTYVPPGASEGGAPIVQPTVAPVLGPLPNVTGTPQGTLGAPGTGAAGGITSDCIYTVVVGDRLFRIAQRFGMSSDALSRANGIVNPNMIVPGQRLHVPNCFAAPPLVFTPTLAPAVVTAIPSTPVPGTGGGQVYVVQEGDTLFAIAMKYGVRVMAIAQANGITNINLIYIGQQLTIP
jgi:LysM repeat protein